MPDELQETLNEFELTPEEQAELERLDAVNGHSDELQDVPAEDPENDGENDDVQVDDDFLDTLTADKDPLAPNDDEENNDNDEDQEDDQAGNPGNAGNGDGDNPGIPDTGNNPDDTPDDELIPPNYEEELSEIGERVFAVKGNIEDTDAQLLELSKKFDDGEIGQGEYDYKRLLLQRQMNKYERELARVEAEQAEVQAEADAKMAEYQKAGQNQWQKAVSSFLTNPANELIANNQHVAEQFDEILFGMRDAGLLEGLNHTQVLTLVRSRLSIDYPQLNDKPYTPNNGAPAQQKKPAKPSQQTATKVPPSLSQMQAIDTPEDDPFAYIRKLTGVDYEVALSKLSPEQQERYLFGG